MVRLVKYSPSRTYSFAVDLLGLWHEQESIKEEEEACHHQTRFCVVITLSPLVEYLNISTIICMYVEVNIETYGSEGSSD